MSGKQNAEGNPQSLADRIGQTRMTRRNIGGWLVGAVLSLEVGVPVVAFVADRWRHAHPTNTVEAGQGIPLEVQGNVVAVTDAQVQFGTAMVNSNDPANPYFVANAEPTAMKIIRVNPIYGDTLPTGQHVPMDTYDIFATADQLAALAQTPEMQLLASPTQDGTPFKISGTQQTAQYTYQGSDGNPVTVFTSQSLRLGKATPYTPHITP